MVAVINIEGSLEAQVASLHLLWEETGCISAVEQAAAAQLGQSIASGGVLCNQVRLCQDSTRSFQGMTPGAALTPGYTRFQSFPLHQFKGPLQLLQYYTWGGGGGAS